MYAGQLQRKMNAKLGHRVLTGLALEQQWPKCWVSDGSKSLYTAEAFLGTDREHVWEYSTRLYTLLPADRRLTRHIRC
eukprot:jgi/Chrzof1/5176/Cz15g14110.t1